MKFWKSIQITLLFLHGMIHGQKIGTDRFEMILFSDSIWSNDMDKTIFSLAASDGGLTECGVLCSVRKDNCRLFQFDLADGTCTIAKEKGEIDWSNSGAKNTLVYVKTRIKGEVKFLIIHMRSCIKLIIDYLFCTFTFCQWMDL